MPEYDDTNKRRQTPKGRRKPKGRIISLSDTQRADVAAGVLAQMIGGKATGKAPRSSASKEATKVADAVDALLVSNSPRDVSSRAWQAVSHPKLPSSMPSVFRRGAGDPFANHSDAADASTYKGLGETFLNMAGRGSSMGGVGSTAGNALKNLFASNQGSVGLADLMGQVMGSMPQAPTGVGVSPSLVDVEATLKPFGQARQNVQAQADRNRQSLAASQAGDGRDVAATNAATQKRLAELETMRALGSKQDVAATQADTQATLRDLGAQGVDATSAAAAGQLAAQQAATASDALKAQIADSRGQADLEAARRAESLGMQSRAATNQLDTALAAAMLGIQQQELKARTDAEQFNAQAMQDAAAQNASLAGDAYAQQMDQWNLKTQLAPALMEQGQAMGAFATPGRAGVIERLMRGENPGVERVILDSLMGADNGDDAWASIKDGLDVYDQNRAASGRTPYTRNTPWIMNLIKRYYTQDTSRWDPQVAKNLLASYGI